LKLLKGLYGLRQASRIWNKRLVAELKKVGLKVCKTEPGVLFHPTIQCYLCLHVDDILVATNNDKLKASIINILKDAFLVKDLGELHKYVGIQVTRSGDSITLDQSAYAERLLRRFKCWDNVKAMKNPATYDKLSKLDVPSTDEEKEEVSKYPYPNVVGSLMYAVTATRPDMMQSVIQLARFMSNWGKPHIKAAQKSLKFLRNTWKDGIKFTKPKNFNGILEIYCFSDSDWAGCPDTRRTTLGYVIIICGGPISWKSQLRKTLAMSSCEGEYMSLSELGKEVIWLCNFLTELGVKYNTPKIFCDSSSAINWAEDPIEHQRTKHVEAQYYYIRDLVAAQKVQLYKVPTENNISDPFTKNVNTEIFTKLRPFIMGWVQVKPEIILQSKPN
jgi:hypothetical protein